MTLTVPKVRIQRNQEDRVGTETAIRRTLIGAQQENIGLPSGLFEQPGGGGDIDIGPNDRAGIIIPCFTHRGLYPSRSRLQQFLFSPAGVGISVRIYVGVGGTGWNGVTVVVASGGAHTIQCSWRLVCFRSPFQ